MRREAPSAHLACGEGLFLPGQLVGVMLNAAAEAVGFRAGGAGAGIAGGEIRAWHGAVGARIAD